MVDCLKASRWTPASNSRVEPIPEARNDTPSDPWRAIVPPLNETVCASSIPFRPSPTGMPSSVAASSTMRSVPPSRASAKSPKRERYALLQQARQSITCSVSCLAQTF
jgi:hypothetical protein